MPKKEHTNNVIKSVLKVILTYGISFDEQYQQWITVEASKYDKTTNEPIIWKISRGGYVMSKYTGTFDYEPTPSNRDEDYFKEYRFDSFEEASECWSKYYIHNQVV